MKYYNTSIALILTVTIFTIHCQDDYSVAYYNTINELLLGQKKTQLTGLLIKPSYDFTSISSKLDKRILDKKFAKLKWLFIFNQLNEVEALAFSNLKEIEHILLFGNEIRYIKHKTFALIKLNHLSLENNQIETLDDGAFINAKINILDLSFNKLTMRNIPRAAFYGSCTVKKLMVTHNKLTALNLNEIIAKNLKILNVDYNQITDIINDNFQSLEELTLSHNTLKRLPKKIALISSLKKLNIAFNSISQIDSDDFASLIHLEYLNLAGNAIYEFDFGARFSTNIESLGGFKLNLALNALSCLNLNDNNERINGRLTLSLAGNPWNCQCRDNISDKFIKDEFMELEKCDEKLTAKAVIPYCYLETSIIDVRTYDSINLINFHEMIKSELSNNADCDLFD